MFVLDLEAPQLYRCPRARLQSPLVSSRYHMLARYVPPAAPTLRSAPPRGEQWLHEIKFDGWRIQLHKHGGSAAVFTKNGHDHSSRVRWMTDALACLPGVRSLVIDGELVACDDTGLPDFYALHFHSRDHGLCVWAFDLLHHNGRDLRELPLSERKARLERLILAANANWLRYSESFDDGLALLKAADRMRLEGIVSKRRDAPYRSGKQCDWIKVKCETWREANKERWRLFERRS
jgi:bifunctional non-homologous end joining protein LigD